MNKPSVIYVLKQLMLKVENFLLRIDLATLIYLFNKAARSKS